MSNIKDRLEQMQQKARTYVGDVERYESFFDRELRVNEKSKILDRMTQYNKKRYCNDDGSLPNDLRKKIDRLIADVKKEIGTGGYDEQEQRLNESLVRNLYSYITHSKLESNRKPSNEKGIITNLFVGIRNCQPLCFCVYWGGAKGKKGEAFTADYFDFCALEKLVDFLPSFEKEPIYPFKINIIFSDIHAFYINNIDISNIAVYYGSLDVLIYGEKKEDYESMYYGPLMKLRQTNSPFEMMAKNLDMVRGPLLNLERLLDVDSGTEMVDGQVFLDELGLNAVKAEELEEKALLYQEKAKNRVLLFKDKDPKSIDERMAKINDKSHNFENKYRLHNFNLPKQKPISVQELANQIKNSGKIDEIRKMAITHFAGDGNSDQAMNNYLWIRYLEFATYQCMFHKHIMLSFGRDDIERLFSKMPTVYLGGFGRQGPCPHFLSISNDKALLSEAEYAEAIELDGILYELAMKR